MCIDVYTHFYGGIVLSVHCPFRRAACAAIYTCTAESIPYTTVTEVQVANIFELGTTPTWVCIGIDLMVAQTSIWPGGCLS